MRARSPKYSLVLVATAALVLGCTKQMSQSDTATLASTQEFGFHLFAQLVSDSAAKNVVISPASVEMSLAMAANGATGKTQSEMADVLGVPATELGRLNQANAALLNMLTGSGRRVELTFANSLWGRQGLEFAKPFLNVCGRYYSASARMLDFASPTAVREVNAWVANKTHGSIPTIIGSIDAGDVALMLSAVHFRCRWAMPFNPELTAASYFHLMDGGQVERPMMWREGDFGCLTTDSFSAVALPFAGRRFSMYVFVPADTNGLPGFLRKLSYDNWRAWTSEFRAEWTTVGLPRFTTEYETSLTSGLIALGMTTAFDSARAEFAPMVASPPDWPIRLSGALHKVFIEVNEEGARVAVATAGSTEMTGLPHVVAADRPFFFAITDTVSGLILFMGAVYDPAR